MTRTPAAHHRTARRHALAWAIGLLAAARLARAGTPGEVGVGQMLRDATLQGLNGPSRPLKSFRGKPLVINVWASWCGPCRAETASLERLAWSEAGTHFTVIGISTDDYPQAARAWLRQSNATLNHFIDERLRDAGFEPVPSNDPVVTRLALGSTRIGLRAVDDYVSIVVVFDPQELEAFEVAAEALGTVEVP